jgi:alkylation response protein AidB-like acyl-CoA dehydrogenase
VDLTPTAEEEAFRAEVRGWLEANRPGPEPDDEDDAFAFRRDWQRKLYDAGWVGVAWPTEYGGRGASLIEQAIFVEEMSRVRAPQLANMLGVTLAGPTIIGHGTEEQKQRYLAPMLSAEEIWCQGFSEPDSGSDLASLKTRAVRHGDEWIVTGQKVWTTFAQHAKWCMLVARTDPDAAPHRGLSYLIMDMEQEGVQVRPLRQITGENEFNELFIEEARVPADAILGAEGNGWMVAITTLMHERSTLSLDVQVEFKAALGDLGDLIREHGLGADPVVRQRFAELYIGSEELRLRAYRGLTKTMKYGIPGPEGSLGKWAWSELHQSLTEFALDLLGPDAALFDDRWSPRLLRARANSIEGGTTEVLKNIVAERVLGLPRMR